LSEEVLTTGRINVVEIRRVVGTRRPFRVVLSLRDAVVGETSVDPDVPVEADIVVESVSGGVTVLGTVAAQWIAPCRRCMTELRERFVVPIDELFEEHPTEGESYPIVQDVIDVEPMLREVLLIEIPPMPLCSEECLGPVPEVYPVTVESDDDGPPADPRWAALDVLKEQK
jgi:uncharacterized protein